MIYTSVNTTLKKYEFFELFSLPFPHAQATFAIRLDDS